jgi:DNA-binding MarR family transcriptional regulator
MPTPLPLLLNPRDTLPVLQHLAENPTQSPWVACKATGLSSHTFYEVTAHLESLGLIVPTKGPAGRKVLRYLVTPEGERVVARLGDILAEIAGSRAGLEWELAKTPPLRGSPRAGAVLCGLIELAERRGDFKGMAGLRAGLNERRTISDDSSKNC